MGFLVSTQLTCTGPSNVHMKVLTYAALYTPLKGQDRQKTLLSCCWASREVSCALWRGRDRHTHPTHCSSCTDSREVSCAPWRVWNRHTPLTHNTSVPVQTVGRLAVLTGEDGTDTPLLHTAHISSCIDSREVSCAPWRVWNRHTPPTHSTHQFLYRQ